MISYKKYFNLLIYPLVLMFLLINCTTNKTMSQNDIIATNDVNINVNPNPALFGTWIWTQDENFRIQATISADSMEYEFHNLGSHSVSVTLSDIIWIAEENPVFSHSSQYPTGYKIQGIVTSNSIYEPENTIWPEEIGNIYSISIFLHQSDSQKALILFDELKKQS